MLSQVALVSIRKSKSWFLTITITQVSRWAILMDVEIKGAPGPCHSWSLSFSALASDVPPVYPQESYLVCNSLFQCPSCLQYVHYWVPLLSGSLGLRPPTFLQVTCDSSHGLALPCVEEAPTEWANCFILHCSFLSWTWSLPLKTLKAVSTSIAMLAAAYARSPEFSVWSSSASSLALSTTILHST